MVGKYYCDVQYTHFIWTVKYPNFSLGCDIRSPSFSVDSFGNTRFYTKLFSEKEDEDYNYVSVHLAKHETFCGPNSITFNTKFSASNGFEDEYYTENVVSFRNGPMVLLEKCSFKKKIEYCPYDSIMIRLEIEPAGEDSEVDNIYCCNQKELEMLSSDLNRALRAKRFCDLTFRSIEGTRSVKLHKCILAARYPKLATRLEIVGNDNRDVNLGVDFEAINMLSQYLYSGSLDTGNTAFGLHDLLRRAELDHLEHALYPTPRIMHASTSVSSKYGSFIWIIPKFSSLEKGKILVNTLCIDVRLEWTKLRVLLYIREDASGEECLAFKIVRTEQGDKMYALCTISFAVDIDGQHSKTYEHVFRAEREWNVMCFAKKRLIEEKKYDFLQDDTLKLKLEFIISDLEETSEYESVKCLEVKRGDLSPVSMNLCALQRDLKSMYLDPSYSDCTLQVRDELIPAHKVILSARSPVFLRMFEDDTSENKSGLVVINGFQTCVIKNMLSYIYCGELPEESKKHILRLYQVAHEYQVTQLTEKCSRIIGSLLVVCDVGDVLKIADECNDQYLKECVKDFVCSHADEVFESEEWGILKKERIDLTAGIINAAIKSVD